MRCEYKRYFRSNLLASFFSYTTARILTISQQCLFSSKCLSKFYSTDDVSDADIYAAEKVYQHVYNSWATTRLFCIVAIPYLAIIMIITMTSGSVILYRGLRRYRQISKEAKEFLLENQVTFLPIERSGSIMLNATNSEIFNQKSYSMEGLQMSEYSACDKLETYLQSMLLAV